VNGRGEGTWNWREKRNRTHITIRLLDRIPENVRKQLEEEVADLVRFNGTAYELSFSKAC
jgi:2'-5' RNA ligase